jgi:flagellar motor switch protein FliM
VSKDQIRSLHFLHDRFARDVSTSLGAYLRTTTELSLVSVEQFSYSEFLMALPDPTAFYGIAMPPFDALGALEINPSVAFVIVDRMLGGAGRTGAIRRALTEIELNVIDSIIQLFLEQLTEAWRAVAEVTFQVHSRETRPQMLHVAGRNEIVVVLVFDLRLGDARGMLHFCIPASIIEAARPGFVQGWQQTRREPTPREQRWLAENLGSVPLTVTTSMEARLLARDVLAIVPGEVLNLGIPMRVPIDLHVGNVMAFRGRLTTDAGMTAVLVQQTCGRVADAAGMS